MVQIAIGFNQASCMKHGLDLFDATVFSVVSSLMQIPRFQKVESNGVQFTWVCLSAIIKAAPILGTTRKGTFSVRINKLCRKGIFKKFIRGRKLFIAPGAEYEGMFYCDPSIVTQKVTVEKIVTQKVTTGKGKKTHFREQIVTPSVTTTVTSSVTDQKSKTKKYYKSPQNKKSTKPQDPALKAGGVPDSDVFFIANEHVAAAPEAVIVAPWQEAKDAAQMAILNAGYKLTDIDYKVFTTERNRAAWAGIHDLECGDLERIGLVFAYAYKHALGQITPTQYRSYWVMYDQKPDHRPKRNRDGMDGAREVVAEMVARGEIVAP
jgi:hypothetical protein